MISLICVYANGAALIETQSNRAVTRSWVLKGERAGEMLVKECAMTARCSGRGKGIQNKQTHGDRRQMRDSTEERIARERQRK